MMLLSNGLLPYLFPGPPSPRRPSTSPGGRCYRGDTGTYKRDGQESPKRIEEITTRFEFAFEIKFHFKLVS